MEAMTIDQAIAALVAAKEKLGGHRTLWVAGAEATDKWAEQMVVGMDSHDDGESCYLRLVSRPGQ